MPGFEAPVTVGYATSNRSAVIRIPAYAKTPNMRRFELRNPDATCNPYFCYAALLMAGLDGIENKIDPHENGWGPYDVNLYTLSDEEKAKLQGLPTSLDAALDALEADHDYLTKGGVFPEALLRSFIAAKRKECAAMAAIPHPAEFERYYNAPETTLRAARRAKENDHGTSPAGSDHRPARTATRLRGGLRPRGRDKAHPADLPARAYLAGAS